MRCTQLIGLREKAVDYLEENVKMIPDPCPHCREVLSLHMASKVYAQDNHGMFDDGPSLREYEMQDSSVLREVVQAAPWSSGPCIFLCLEDKETGRRMFEWSKEEINDA